MADCEDTEFITCENQMSWEQLGRLLIAVSDQECPAVRTVVSPPLNLGAFNDSFDDSFDN